MAFENFEYWDAVKQARYKKTIDDIKENIAKFDGDVNKMMDFALNAVCDASHSVAGTFWYYDVNGDGFIRAFSVRGGTDISNIRLKLGEGISGSVIKTGEPVKIYDVKNDEKWSSKSDDDSGFVTKSMICVPLTVNDYTFGCIQLVNKDDDSFFDEKDFELVLYLAKDISKIVDEYNVFPELRDYQDASIIFVKMDNYDNLATLLAPRQLIDLLNQYLTMIEKTVKKFDGNIDIFDYENVVAYWIDKGKESSANKACQAAEALLELQNEIRLFISKKFGYDIYYSIGIAYGHVYKKEMGTESLTVRTIAGSGVCEAKDMQSLAELGTCMANKAMFEQVGDKFRFEKVAQKNKLFGKKNDNEDATYFLL